MMQGHDRESLRATRIRIAERFPERSHDMTFLRHQALSDMFAAAGHPTSQADAAFEIFFHARNQVALYEEVEQALKRLSERYRLFALSNGNADLKRCRLDHWFEGHVTAISAGAPKPDARIFAQLQELAGVEASRIVHVGDDPDADVMGAARAGMQAVWLNRDEKIWPAHLPAPARTIKSLNELS